DTRLVPNLTSHMYKTLMFDGRSCVTYMQMHGHNQLWSTLSKWFIANDVVVGGHIPFLTRAPKSTRTSTALSLRSPSPCAKNLSLWQRARARRRTMPRLGVETTSAA